MTSGWAPWKRLVAAVSCALWLSLVAAQAAPLRSDEDVIVFPTAARLSADVRHWLVPIHGWVFERWSGNDGSYAKTHFAALKRVLDAEEPGYAN